jgi:glycosyltransferase involved in cell wall biosynthesis
MPHQPTLSICVPSRNRQIWFQETIRALTASLRTDIELVFVDNSDDPSVMNSFIAPFLADPRVKYVPTGDEVRPMVDNWEVAFGATTGRWIVFIGDDDHVDPELAGLILRIEAKMPDVEALDWARLHFTWPYPGKPAYSNPVPLLSEIHEVPKKQLKERAFRWDHARDVLGCGFGIYHGAVSRVLMERLRVASKTGRWFEHPIVDYDNIFKVIMHGRRFAHIRRPLSVMGVCPASNTASIVSLADAKKKAEAFHAEHKKPLDAMECYQDFPFRSYQGVTACIAMTHHWYAREYGYDFSGFEENFARSCALQCASYPTREEFDAVSASYRETFRTWKGGRYLRFFKPEFTAPKRARAFGGLLDGTLFYNDEYETVATPAEFYRLAEGMIQPIADLVIDFDRVKVADTAAA